MSAQANQSISVQSEAAEPKAGRRAVPVWLLILLFILLYWGMVYFDQRGAWANPQVYIPYRSMDEVQALNLAISGQGGPSGKPFYEQVCALCHGSDGMGKPSMAPPFVGSEWVLGNPNRLIRIPLVGLTGPVQVNGKEWNLGLSMAPMGKDFKDEDLAAVLTYIRQSWGNKAPAITPEQVKAVRAEVGKRVQAWTAAELNTVQ